MESGSAVRARRGLVGPAGTGPGQPREKPTSPANRRPSLSQVLAGSAQEEQPLAAAEELSAQKREQRLRKFRELHLKRVSRGCALALAGPLRVGGGTRKSQQRA